MILSDGYNYCNNTSEEKLTVAAYDKIVVFALSANSLMNQNKV